MDAQTVIMAISGIGSVAVGIAIGRQMTLRRDLNNIGQKVHRIDDWRNATLPKHLEATYTRKDVIDTKLTSMQEQIEHIGAQVDRLVGRP